MERRCFNGGRERRGANGGSESRGVYGGRNGRWVDGADEGGGIVESNKMRRRNGLSIDRHRGREDTQN